MFSLLTERTNRFSQRVEIERKVISILNNKFGSMRPISGLTKNAYANWKTKISDKLSPEQNSRMDSTISEIIYRVQVDCDASKDVFHEPPLDLKENSIDILIGRLNSIFK